MDERRSRRVSEAVREELAELVSFELDDPRLLGVDITDVIVSPDLRHAHARVAVRGDERAQRQALAALDHAANFLRRTLAARMQLRRTPELHFSVDAAGDAENRVEILLKRVKKRAERPKTRPE